MTENNQTEQWKAIEGYEQLYHVSNAGRVKSLLRVVKTEKYSYPKSEKTLKPVLMNSGYYTVTLAVNSELSPLPVHRIVAFAFCPNPLGHTQVNHKNGIKTDNRAENLEWCSRSDNMLHAYSTGLMPKTRKRRSKLI